jgi:hypothetical protein
MGNKRTIAEIGEVVDTHIEAFAKARETVVMHNSNYPASFGDLVLKFALFAGACKELGISLQDVQVFMAQVAIEYKYGIKETVLVPNGIVPKEKFTEMDILPLSLPKNYAVIGRG